MKKYLSILLPIIGLAFAAYWVVISARTPQAAPPVNPPAQSSFRTQIAGAGIIESAGRNINVAPPIPGQVAAIFVKENDTVKRGDRLFRIDDREQLAKIASADATIAKAEAAVATARTDIANQQAAEQSAQANIEAQKALLADAQQIFERNEKLYQAGDLAQGTYTSNKAARDAARARVAQAEAQLAQTRAQLGSAQARLTEAESNLTLLRAQRKELTVTLDRLTVTAPQDGRILQINMRLGEFIASTPQQPPILLGETDMLQVRVDVDEINASRLTAGGPATASLKGDSGKKFTLDFVRIDPYILPKKSLTGDNTERVDVRVLQVIYRFAPPAFPVYVGQQVDVFIDTSSAAPVAGK